jgi:hypothetical protein
MLAKGETPVKPLRVAALNRRGDREAAPPGSCFDVRDRYSVVTSYRNRAAVTAAAMLDRVMRSFIVLSLLQRLRRERQTARCDLDCGNGCSC